MAATRVLVVDDDAESRELLSEVLGSSGYAVTTVEDGAAARDALAGDDSYAIVIADLHMPNGTGLDLLQYLRRRRSKQGIVLMSSFMSGQEKKLAIDMGARALLEKPFRLSELLQVVDDLAAKRPLSVAP